MVTFSEEHLENIKSNLFGQQKQASVINQSVVKLVARELSEVMGYSSSVSVDDANGQIVAYLHHVENNPSGGYNPDVFILVAGEQSLANVKSGELTTVSVTDASETSTKHHYRILVDGQDPDIDMSGKEGSPIRMPSMDHVSADEERGQDYMNRPKRDPNADFYTQAKQLLEAIRPLIPDAVKTEIPDNEFAQALVCAETYFGYNH